MMNTMKWVGYESVNEKSNSDSCILRLQGGQGLCQWRSRQTIVVVLHSLLDGDVELYTPRWWWFGVLLGIRKLRRFRVLSVSEVKPSILPAHTVSTVDLRIWEPPIRTLTTGLRAWLYALGSRTGNGRLAASLNWTVRPRRVSLVLSLKLIQSIRTTKSEWSLLTLQEESSRTLRRTSLVKLMAPWNKTPPYFWRSRNEAPWK